MTQTTIRNEQITSENASDGDVLTANGSGGAAWEAPATPGAVSFTDLTDVPTSYSGQGGKFVRVKSTADGLEFTSSGASGQYLQFLYEVSSGTFTFLTDATGNPLMGLEDLQ